MANNLSDFIALIKKNSIARMNRFRITFTIPEKVASLSNFIGKDDVAKTISLTCLISDIPGQTNQASSNVYGNYERKIVFGRSMSDFSTTFLVTGKYVEKKLFDVWCNIINDEGNHCVGFYDDYITSINLECLNEQDVVVYRTEIQEAYPLVVGSLKLDRTAQNAQMTIDVTWAFFRCEVILDNVNITPPVIAPPILGVDSNSGVKRLLPIPGLDQMSSAVQGAVNTVKEFRGQLQGVLNIANDVREQVRDFKMSVLDGVKTLNGVVKDVKAIRNIPTDVKNEVVAVVNDTKNQIGLLKNDIHTINVYPTR